MSIWSAWEDISRVMAVLCLVTAGAAFVAAGILLVREELTGRLWDTLKSEAGKRKGILILAAAGVWILVIGRSVSAAEVTQAGSTASTAASTEAGTESESSPGLTSGPGPEDMSEPAPGDMSEAAAEGISETAVATAAESTSEAESATAGGSEADDPEAEKSAEGSGTAEAATEGKTDDGKNAAEKEAENNEADKETDLEISDEESPAVAIMMTEETNEDEEGLIYCRKDNAGIRIRFVDDREGDTGIISYRVVVEDSEGREIRRESSSESSEGTEGESAANAQGSPAEGADGSPTEDTEGESEPSAGEFSLGIVIGTEEIAQLADGTINVTAWAVDAAGNEGEARFTFVLDTESPLLTEIRTFSCKGEAETEVPAETVYDGKDLYYNDERQVTRVKIEDDSPVFWRMQYYFLPGKGEKEQSNIVSRQIEGQGAEGSASVSEEGIYSEWLISGEDLAGNRLLVSEECRCTQDAEDHTLTDEGILLGRRRILDRTAPVGEICYRSDAKGFLYRGKSLPGEDSAEAEVYFGGDVEVFLRVSDRCAGAEMPVDPGQFKLVRTENGVGLQCEDGKYVVGEDREVRFGAFGRDRAGNALIVRDVFRSPVEPRRSDGSETSGTGGNETLGGSERERQADEESFSYGPVIVRDTVSPVGRAVVSRPIGNPAGIDEENEIVYFGKDPGQYGDGVPAVTVSLRVSDLNPDPDRTRMRTAFVEVPDGKCCEDVKPQWSDAVQEDCEVKVESAGKGSPEEVLMTLRKFPGREGTPDGVYRFGIVGTDKAGNPLVLAGDEGENPEALFGFVCVNAEEGAFMTGRKVIDTKAPRGEISIANDEDEVYCRMAAHGRGWTSERDGFMPFRRETEAVIRYSASDTSPVSASGRLLSTAGERNEAAPGADRFLSDCEGKIRIHGGQIFRIENWGFRDRAGNTSAVLKRTVDFYLDTQLPEADIDAPTAVVRAVPEITSRSADGRGLYKGAVTLEIMAEDPDRDHGGSGLKEVICSVRRNGETVMEEVVFRGGEGPAEPMDEAVPDPVYRFSSEITIPSGGEWESNDIEVTVMAQDNAGNRSDPGNGGTLLLGIDSTGPAVSVSYDNNEVRNGRYFGAQRKALIEVRERNFAKEKLKVTAPGAVVGEWKRSDSSDLWTLEVEFAVDGEYTLDVSGTDALGNAASVTYEGSAPQAFAIDRIPPVIEVVWDNEDVRNGKYYNSPRVATIRITELSLDERAVQISPFSRALRRVSQTRDERTTGVVSVYEAEVPFTEEGEWSLRCACMDLAGNIAVPVYEEPFIIDMTAPRLYFDPDSVREMGAYGSGISPVLLCEDQNIVPGSLYAAWYNLTAGGSVMECRNGSVRGGAGEVSLPDLPEERAADGICALYGTACDLAGNRSRVRRNLCVNRFGSLYDISEDPGTAEIVNGYYTDATAPFVIAEYNVSPVRSRKITLYRNSGARVLEEGADYQVTQEQGAAGMKYVYVIDPAAYREEGKYSILIESEDEAGNICRSPGRFRGGTEFSPTWAVDRTPPQVRVVPGDADRRKFVADSVELRLVPSDNMEVKSLEIEVADDKGGLIEKQVIGGQELREIMDRNGGEVPVTIHAGAGWQTLRAEAIDGAGSRSSGMQGVGEDGHADGCRVLVSSNLMVHLYRSGILPAVAFLALLSAFRFAYSVYKRALA